MEYSDTEVEINRAWKTIRETNKILGKDNIDYFELKKHKPWFNKGCLKLLCQRKQAKVQWLQDSIIGVNLSNVRNEASRCVSNNEGISERQK
jgi:hypothetical protein